MLKLNFNLNSAQIARVLQDKSAIISARRAALMQSVAAEMEADIKESLNVPVQVAEGKTVRSLPGQPPRRQSGLLQESIETRINVQGETITLSAGDLQGKAPYALYMEYGTLSILPRPYLLPALSKYGQIMTREIKNLGRNL